MAATGLRALALATACASSAATRPGEPPTENAEGAIVDLATEFVATACQEAPGAEFAQAWLAYEGRHQHFFEATYYRSEEYRAERPTLAEKLGPRRDEICAHVRTFLVAAPGTIDRLKGKVADLMGHAPQATTYFAVALQWTDGKADTFDGREIIALNARHPAFATTSDLVTLIAHELIHDAQNVAARGELQRLPPVARSLYGEGGAVFGVQVLFPGLGPGPLAGLPGVRPDQLNRADAVASQAAAHMLRVLRAPQPGAELARFFQGGQADPLLPPRMGYYLGAKVYQDLARSRGDLAAARIAPADFVAAAETYLTNLSRQSDGRAGQSLRSLSRPPLNGSIVSRTGINEHSRPAPRL
jgi:hypothetical protein